MVRRARCVCGQVLRRADLADTAWRQAPIVVANNRQRHAFNHFLLTQYALEHNMPIVRWRLPFTNTVTAYLAPRPLIRELLYARFEHELTGYFVPGLRVFLTYNLAQHRRLANGTIVPLVSLGMRTPADNEDLGRRFRAAAAGDFVDLDIPPLTVNVRVLPSPSQPVPIAWPAAATIDADDVVIPLKLTHTDKVEMPGDVAKTISFRSFGFELPFSVTFHKVQGLTVPRIVLDLNPYPGSSIKLAMFFVGISRVRFGSDMRIMPWSPTARSSLLRQRFPPALLDWWATRVLGRPPLPATRVAGAKAPPRRQVANPRRRAADGAAADAQPPARRQRTATAVAAAAAAAAAIVPSSAVNASASQSSAPSIQRRRPAPPDAATVAVEPPRSRPRVGAPADVPEPRSVVPIVPAVLPRPPLPPRRMPARSDVFDTVRSAHLFFAFCLITRSSTLSDTLLPDRILFAAIEAHATPPLLLSCIAITRRWLVRLLLRRHTALSPTARPPAAARRGTGAGR